MVFPLVALWVISALWRTSTSSSVLDFGMFALFKWYPSGPFQRITVWRFGLALKPREAHFKGNEP